MRVIAGNQAASIKVHPQAESAVRGHDVLVDVIARTRRVDAAAGVSKAVVFRHVAKSAQ
jgi:mannose-6-phosphate isomerase class I